MPSRADVMDAARELVVVLSLGAPRRAPAQSTSGGSTVLGQVGRPGGDT